LSWIAPLLLFREPLILGSKIELPETMLKRSRCSELSKPLRHRTKAGGGEGRMAAAVVVVAHT